MNNFFGPKFWHDIHGGSTHFPIALIVAALVFDFFGYVIHSRDPVRSRELHAAGFYALLLGALISFASILSGLLITGWETMGAGALRLHHLFAWQAFGLIIALAVWRALVRNQGTRKAMVLFIVVELAAAGFMLLAGYEGGLMR